MNWKKLGSQIAGMGADILGEALPFPGAGAAVDAVANAFGAERKPGAISEAIQNNPEAATKLREIEANHEAELAAEISKRQGNVNQTIQAGYQQGVLWRRAVGWSLAVIAPLVVLGVLGIAGYALSTGQPELIQHVPGIVSALAPVWYVYLTVLGVAGYQEGKLGRALAGDSEGGISKAIKAIRG